MTTAGARLERGRKVGEYEIVRKLGVGGMGVVYEGHQPLIGKRVAVKVLLPSLSENAEQVGRFLSEARAVNAIRHRGIVDIFSFGQIEDGSHYFVMEYLEGRPFDRLIRERAPLPPMEALRYFEETLDALGAAHEAGIIHRDIKPSNLFLVDTGRGQPYVKLLDFGIAKLDALKGQATPQTRASVVIGTPNYISPEQARGLPVSAATDLYAMGCVLFELLTGRLPFETDSPLEALFLHVEQPPPPPSKFLAGLPPQLDELVLWTLEKKPSQRPGSAEELRSASQALRQELGESQGTDGRRPSTHSQSSDAPRAERTRQVPRTIAISRKRRHGKASRRRGLWLAGVAAAAVLGAGGWFVLRASTAPKLAPLPAAHWPVPAPESARNTAARAAPDITAASSPARTTPAVATPTALEPTRAALSPATPDIRTATAHAPESARATSAHATPASAATAAPAPEPTRTTSAARSRASKSPTSALLIERIHLLERRLATKEAKSGDRDEVLRQFLAQARKDAARADTAAERKDVWQLLEDLQQQLEAK